MPGYKIKHVYIAHPHDRNAVTEIVYASRQNIHEHIAAKYHDGVTGELLYSKRQPSTTRLVFDYFDGLHRLPIDSYTLRWLYLILGFGSYVMLASGLLLWLKKITPMLTTKS